MKNIDLIDLVTSFKKGGWLKKAVNPEHKGYCTPMTKPTCTPRRKALAKRFKSGEFKKKHQDGGIINNDLSKFQQWLKTTPSNLRFTKPKDYDMKLWWETLGKPDTWEQAVKENNLTPENDGLYHGFSRDPRTGRLIKDVSHKTFRTAVEGDEKAGYKLYSDDKNYYTLNKEEFEQSPIKNNLIRTKLLEEIEIKPKSKKLFKTGGKIQNNSLIKAEKNRIVKEINNEFKQFKNIIFNKTVDKKTLTSLYEEFRRLGTEEGKKHLPDKMQKGGNIKSSMSCNKPKRTPTHKTKSHVVKACEGGKEKIIRFGQQGVVGSPKKEGESESYKKRRESFKARHSCSTAKSKLTARHWACKTKW